MRFAGLCACVLVVAGCGGGSAGTSASLLVRIGGQHAGGCLGSASARDTYTLVSDNGSNPTLAVAEHTRWDGCQLEIRYPFSRSYDFFDVVNVTVTEQCGAYAWGPFDAQRLSGSTLTLSRVANRDDTVC